MYLNIPCPFIKYFIYLIQINLFIIQDRFFLIILHNLEFIKQIKFYLINFGLHFIILLPIFLLLFKNRKIKNYMKIYLYIYIK